MRIERIVPDLETQDIDRTRAFYTGLLGMRVAMDLGWIVTLRTDLESVQLSLMTHDAAAPVTPGLTIEVGDVDAVHAEAKRRGDRIVYPLTDEAWGVRRFFVEDPDGVIVNVMCHR